MLFAFNQNSCAVFSNVEQKGLRRVECDTKKKKLFCMSSYHVNNKQLILRRSTNEHDFNRGESRRKTISFFVYHSRWLPCALHSNNLRFARAITISAVGRDEHISHRSRYHFEYVQDEKWQSSRHFVLTSPIHSHNESKLWLALRSPLPKTYSFVNSHSVQSCQNGWERERIAKDV